MSAARSPLEWSLQFTTDELALFWLAAIAAAVGAVLVAPTGRTIRAWPVATKASLLAIVAAACGIALAGNPLTLLAFWELHDVSMFAFLWMRREPGRDAAPRAAGAMLLTGLVFDGLLVMSAVAGAPLLQWPVPQDTAAPVKAVSALLGLGMILAAVGRCGAVPASGWLRKLAPADAETRTVLFLLGTLPASAILFLRAAALLGDGSLQLTGLLLLAAALTGITGWTQPEWPTAVCYAAAAIGALMGALSLAVGGLTAAIGNVLLIVLASGLLRRHSPPAFLARSEVIHVGRSPSQLLQLAARDWGVPRFWWSVIELPLRGTAQVMRFVDGFLFDQVIRRSLRMTSRVVSRFGQSDADQPAWWPAVALLVSAGVLMVMSWRSR